MKSIVMKMSIIFLFLSSFVWSTAAYSQQMIVVRIINPHNAPVVVHSRVYNAYGYANWVVVTQVAPMSYVDIPNVPIGAMLGVDCPAYNRAWRPFQVYVISRFPPNYVYQVPRY